MKQGEQHAAERGKGIQAAAAATFMSRASMNSRVMCCQAGGYYKCSRCPVPVPLAICMCLTMLLPSCIRSVSPRLLPQP